MIEISRKAYCDMYGPTVGDRVRLGDTSLIAEVEKDLTVHGDEAKFGGGKSLRDGMGQSCKATDKECLDTVITNALIIDSTGIIKADVGIKDGRITEEARAQVNLLLKQSFRPEFLNRIDDIVFYKPLDKEEIFKITDLMLEDIRKRLKERRLDVKLTDRAKNYLAETGYDPQYGARPLKRLLSSKLETLLARKIIEGDPAPDTVFTVDYDGENLTVSESKGE